MAILGQRAVTLLQYTASQPVYTNGRLVLPTPVSTTVYASVQPPSDAQLQRLPEGLRAKVTRIALTETAIRTVEDSVTPAHSADRITVDGQTFEIVSVETWPTSGPLPHWECALVRLDATGGTP